MAANAARAQREAERQRKRQLAEQARLQRAIVRDCARVERLTAEAMAAASKDARARRLQEREDHVAELNQQLAATIEELRGILEATLSVDDTIAFDSLRVRDPEPPLELPRPPTPQTVPVPPSFLARLVPGTERRHQEALARHRAEEYVREREWQTEVDRRKAEHAVAVRALESKVQQRDHEVQEWESAYRASDPDAIVAYNTMVLERSEYPDGFPQHARLAYLPESKQLVIEYELPGPLVVPSVTEYTFGKSRDVIQERPRKPAEIKELYQEIVAAVALRTVSEVLEADQGEHIDVVVFNGFVEAVDPATGREIRPHLVSVRTTKEEFLQLDLRRVDRRACLRNLGAQVSPRPAELQPIKPVVEFDMADRRFVDQADILSGLDARPNLMDLTPNEFEALVSNLFGRMGLDTRLTQSSRDGGVDAIAFDLRPVIGGKVVIQAKRYRHTVGVSAVRDLYGTMNHEGANKGILVSTSGYGPDAYTFAKDKPIELIDGGGLLFLLEDNGIQARIVFPEEQS
jgi:restriction system protein